jgi:hypothetical protein
MWRHGRCEPAGDARDAQADNLSLLCATTWSGRKKSFTPCVRHPCAWRGNIRTRVCPPPQPSPSRHAVAGPCVSRPTPNPLHPPRCWGPLCVPPQPPHPSPSRRSLLSLHSPQYVSTLSGLWRCMQALDEERAAAAAAAAAAAVTAAEQQLHVQRPCLQRTGGGGGGGGTAAAERVRGGGRSGGGGGGSGLSSEPTAATDGEMK